MYTYDGSDRIYVSKILVFVIYFIFYRYYVLVFGLIREIIDIVFFRSNKIYNYLLNPMF